MPGSWQIGPIREDAPPAVRAYVGVLRQLAEESMDSLSATATALSMSKSVVSRILRAAGRKPDWEQFSKPLHYAATVRAAHADDVAVSESTLRKLHDEASDAAFRSRGELHEENQRLRLENQRLREEHRAAVADTHVSAPLPVPRQAGDRQGSTKTPRAARELSTSAVELAGHQRDEALLDVIRESAEILTPLESAAAVALLQTERHGELAGTVAHIYGREQPDMKVIHIAYELLQTHHLPTQAGTALRAALEGTAGWDESVQEPEARPEGTE